VLKKANRLTKNNDFDRVFKNGRSAYTKVLGVKALNNDSPDSRFGILIGLKVSKKAVIRNRFKRQIRAVIEKELPKLRSGVDVVIIVFPLILANNFKEVESALVSLFKKLNLYNK